MRSSPRASASRRLAAGAHDHAARVHLHHFRRRGVGADAAGGERDARPGLGGLTACCSARSAPGAVLGAATSTWFRARFSAEAIIRAAGIVYGLGCLGVAYNPGLPAMLALLVLAGAGWVQALSGFSVAGQLWSPREIVGRITAMVSSLTFGGIALGSWLWGHFAEATAWRWR